MESTKKTILANQQKKILIAPLDWGLGHAARCIPIIKKLLERNVEVFLGGSGNSGKFLQMEFPNLPYEEIPGYEVSYSLKLPMSIAMLRQVPGILRSIQQEKKWLDEKIEKDKIDIVISDHRYGLHNKKANCIFIGHQLFISAGGNELLEPVLWKVNKSYIEHFDICWIPDIPDDLNAAGKLSHKSDIPFKHSFIGLLSRLDANLNKASIKKYKVAFILSGLEPLRTELENKLIDQSDLLEKGEYVLVRGTIENLQRSIPANWTTIHIADTNQSSQIIGSSEMVVSRSGYSSIMDYLITRTKALLIPTPGQTEQEYLAKYHHECNHFYTVNQAQLELARDLKLASTYQPAFINNANLLEIAIDELIKQPN